MKIVINFKNKSIVVDEFSYFCDSIAPLEDNWVSLEIDDFEARLYKVGLIHKLTDTSFIVPWVDEALEAKEKFFSLLEIQEQERLINLDKIKENEIISNENMQQYEADYENYLLEVAKADEVNRKIMEEQQKDRSIGEVTYGDE